MNYTYDLDSRLTQVTDPTGTYQFTFDNMGRLTQATASYTFLTSRSFTTSYSYDAASNRTGMTDPENGSTAYVYDTLNRLQTLTPPSAFTTGNFGFGYDALSRRTSLTRPNSITTNYSYDNLSRLLSVLHQSGSTTLDGASYTVDNAGNRTAKTDQRAAVTSNYSYDAIYELTQVTQGTNTTESYTFDPVGNRLTSLAGSYTNNSSNEMTASPTATYTFDNNGNTTSKTDSTGTTNYAWDFENRLSSVTLPGSGGTVQFKYDPFGRRIYKSSSSGTSIYAYDGDNLIEETNASGAVVARYTQTQKIDEPLAMLRSSATSYYHADGLGSVTSLSNSAGALAQTYTFDSFGRQTASSGSLTNPFQYTGRESDSETGLYYYRARYYDAVAGRFLREDPLDSPIHRNQYSYVRNNSPNRVDSSGMLEHPYPHRNCKLVGVLKLTMWTSETDQTPSGDWSFVMSFQQGPEGLDDEVGVPMAVVTCVWERSYTAELWGHVLTTYRYKCWNNNCWGYHEWNDIELKWSVEDLGRHPSSYKDRETTQLPPTLSGAEDEGNDILCQISKVRP